VSRDLFGGGIFVVHSLNPHPTLSREREIHLEVKLSDKAKGFKYLNPFFVLEWWGIGSMIFVLIVL